MSNPSSEKAALLEFLDDQRNALIEKVEGISENEARSTPTESSLSLLSIVKHSTVWERRWFQVIVAGQTFPGEWPEVRSRDSTATFRLEDADTIESVVADYRSVVMISNTILLDADPDTLCAWPEMSDHTVRWVTLHMIEETARHAGHADIIRETIDSRRSA